MKKIIIALFAVVCFSTSIFAQIPKSVAVQIVKAEDERRFDAPLESLLKNPNPKIRKRAALAVGRIGDERGVAALTERLKTESSAEVIAMIVFALGEIESAKGAAAIIEILKNRQSPNEVRARALEAAGKVAAANPNDAQTLELGKIIVTEMQFELNRRSMPNNDAVLLGLTAILRTRPANGEAVAAKFLNFSSPRIRADALNTLSRLKAKTVNAEAREMTGADVDANVRANAARVLGAAEDADSFDVLLKSALNDDDSRVRVSAIRALGSLKDKRAAAKLIERGTKLLSGAKNRKIANPPEKSELLEIASALGRILPNSDDKFAVEFLDELHQADRFSSPETEIALARIAPQTYFDAFSREADEIFHGDWHASSAAFQGLAEFAKLESSKENDLIKSRTRIILAQLLGEWISLPIQTKANGSEQYAISDLIQAFAAFKSENTSAILRPLLEIEQDVFIRATIAGVLAEQPANKENKANVEVLAKAFDTSLLNDKTYNDAELAILDAMFKLDKQAAIPTLLIAVNSKDYLVRKKAFEMLKDDGYKDSDLVKIAVEKFVKSKKNQVLPYSYGGKPGQLLNTNADYVRAVSRKDAKAVLTTDKGVFTIEFAPEAAPLTVDNFIKLAKANYFNGLPIHRVVPNFVVQDGDPRGDGNGGPGWEIRCEINELPFERGAVGMALSGKDTGGSQWFVTHAAQPHLDGGYTVFGRVSETDMKVVDNLVRGDRILTVKIIEGKR